MNSYEEIGMQVRMPAMFHFIQPFADVLRSLEGMATRNQNYFSQLMLMASRNSLKILFCVWKKDLSTHEAVTNSDATVIELPDNVRIDIFNNPVQANTMRNAILDSILSMDDQNEYVAVGFDAEWNHNPITQVCWKKIEVLWE